MVELALWLCCLRATPVLPACPLCLFMLKKGCIGRYLRPFFKCGHALSVKCKVCAVLYSMCFAEWSRLVCRGLRAVFAVNSAIVLLTTGMSTCLDLHAVLCCAVLLIHLDLSAVLCCAVLPMHLGLLDALPCLEVS